MKQQSLEKDNTNRTFLDNKFTTKFFGLTTSIKSIENFLITGNFSIIY